MESREVVNALTIDVEDYFQVSAFESDIRREDWGSFSLRVFENTQRILQLLRAKKTLATFYILGWVAEKRPDLVRAIQDDGHEIGTHSYWHRLIYNLTPNEFRDDLRQSVQVLQDIVQMPITTFRAPSFSICQNSLWSVQTLASEGITTDSSIFPVVHDRYGIPGAPTEPYQIKTTAGDVTEFPPTVYSCFGFNLPVSGGGYFRLYPTAFTHRVLGRINRQGRPFVFYLHPWEFDPEQPKMPKIGSRISRLRHRLNLKRTEPRFVCLLDRFHFAPMRQVLESISTNRSVYEVNENERSLARVKQT